MENMCFEIRIPHHRDEIGITSGPCEAPKQRVHQPNLSATKLFFSALGAWTNEGKGNVDEKCKCLEHTEGATASPASLACEASRRRHGVRGDGVTGVTGVLGESSSSSI